MIELFSNKPVVTSKKIKDEKSNIKIVDALRADFNNFTFYTLIFVLSLTSVSAEQQSNGQPGRGG
jgi:hypothetical protein